VIYHAFVCGLDPGAEGRNFGMSDCARAAWLAALAESAQAMTAAISLDRFAVTIDRAALYRSRSYDALPLEAVFDGSRRSGSRFWKQLPLG
jgi:hypothetical protein